MTEPSVAAVVASMDADTARYAARVRLQGHRIEIIQARSSNQEVTQRSCANFPTAAHLHAEYIQPRGVAQFDVMLLITASQVCSQWQ